MSCLEEPTHWKSRHDAQVAPIEPVVAVARAAKARGLPIAVASGGSTSNVRTGLASTGILHLFDAVVCAEVRRSPDAKINMPRLPSRSGNTIRSSNRTECQSGSCQRLLCVHGTVLCLQQDEYNADFCARPGLHKEQASTGLLSSRSAEVTLLPPCRHHVLPFTPLPSRHPDHAGFHSVAWQLAWPSSLT